MRLPRSMSTTGLFALLLGFAVFASPASAQLQPWEDYEASDSVWIVTHVDLDPGAFGIYLEGLKSTWIAANEVAIKLGQIKSYDIYANQFGSADDFDLAKRVDRAVVAGGKPSRTGLHHHHVDGVTNGVVKFASNAGSLISGGSLGNSSTAHFNGPDNSRSSRSDSSTSSRP